MNRVIPSTLLMLLIFSCTEIIELDSEASREKPVVEGLITDVVGESFIKLSSTFSVFDLSNSNTTTISGATVWVVYDNDSVAFLEGERGLYLPPNGFIGVLGMEYELHIILPTGEQLRSMPERMLPPVTIDSVFAIWNPTIQPGTEQIAGEHNIFVTLSTTGKDNPTFFRTVANGIAEVAAIIQPPPPDCSGEPCFDLCWQFREPINGIVTVAESSNTSEGTFTVQVATEPYDFHSLYYVEVTALSLSEEAFNFWNSISVQFEINGSIFDPQITDIGEGNIFNVNSGSSVIGYFGVSSSRKGTLLFDRSDDAGFRVEAPIVSGQCSNAWPNATQVRPLVFFE